MSINEYHRVYGSYIFFAIICCNPAIIKCGENPSTSTTSSSVEPTSTSTDRILPTSFYQSSSSSSSSVEDQLTPLLLGGNRANSVSNSSTCVTCPLTVCTLSKVSYERKTIHHNWRVDGLPNYITFMEKFHTPFRMESRLKFNTTSPNYGNWTFALVRSGDGKSTSESQDLEENNSQLELSVTYVYVTEEAVKPRLSYDLWLSAHMEDEYVTLPSQISSNPIQSTPMGWTLYPIFVEKGEVIRFQNYWTYRFAWTDIQSQLASLFETIGHESQTVTFKFVINSYEEGLVSSEDANCHSWRDSDGARKEGSGYVSTHGQHHKHQHQQLQGAFYEPNPVNNATWPPFLHHMYAIMKDDKYVDLTVKSGDDEFQIHRVVAAYSSPVLATMIFNKTYDKSESLLDFGEDIGSDVVEELIRYMYTGRVEDIEEIADRLIVAATQYGFPALKKQCESVLIKQVKTENAFSMYELGAEVGSMRLKRRAFNVMKENKSKIVAQSEEFRKLSVDHPDVMYELFLS